MRYYKAQIEEKMTYKKALNKAKKLGLAITRPSDWDGIHLEINGEYVILEKDGSIIKKPEKVNATKAKDWSIVIPTNRALNKLKEI